MLVQAGLSICDPPNRCSMLVDDQDNAGAYACSYLQDNRDMSSADKRAIESLLRIGAGCECEKARRLAEDCS